MNKMCYHCGMNMNYKGRTITRGRKWECNNCKINVEQFSDIDLFIGMMGFICMIIFIIAMFVS